MDFKQAEEEFRQLKARFEAGELTEPEIKAQLQDLMVQDGQGSWWIIGFETERWYRHDGTSWVQADPPGGLSQEAIPVVLPQTETTDSKGLASAARGQGLRKAAAEPATPAPAIPRRTLFLIGIGALLIFSFGGYYLLRDTGRGSAPAPTLAPTRQNPATIAPSSTTRPSQAPNPTTQSSRTPVPPSTSQPEIQVNVAASRAYLYQGPGQGYGLADPDSYSRGAVFTVIARNPAGDWLLCRAPDGIEGWLYIVWVDADFDPLSAPTAATLPPPPPTPTRKPGAPSCTGFGC